MSDAHPDDEQPDVRPDVRPDEQPEGRPEAAPANLQRLDELIEATHRLVRAVDALPDEDFPEPSLLPGWTRAHVVAHLTLNAEGLGGVMRGLAAARDVAMYVSQETRDADIADLAAAPLDWLRERFLASTTTFVDAAVSVPAGGWQGHFRRLEDGAPFRPRVAIPWMRLMEVEIHHGDLATGYRPADWPESFLDRVFNIVVDDRVDGPPIRLRTPDGDVLMGTREGGPTVTGTREDLTWWLLGRGSGEGLIGDPELPELEAWR